MGTIRTLITGLAVVAAGAGATAAVATTSTATAGTARSAGHTFTVTAHQGAESNIDLDAKGFGAGDEDLATATLTRGGRNVGRMVLNCTTVAVAKHADQLCQFVLVMRDGQITASGALRSGRSGPGTFVLPILGGSGHYQGAGGQIAVTATNNDSMPVKVSLR
jgi:hypothetical protein